MKDHEKALQLYLKGYTIPEIEKETGYKQSKIRTWKTRYKWDEKKTTKTATNRYKKPLQNATPLQNTEKPHSDAECKGKGGSDNLISLANRTTEEQREIARKGGINSGISRNAAKAERLSIETLLSYKAPDVIIDKFLDTGVLPEDMQDKKIDMETARRLRQVIAAVFDGDLNANKYLDEKTGQNPALQLKAREISLKEKQETQPQPVSAEYEKLRTMAYSELWEYCKIKSPDFYTDDTDYLKEICDALDAFLKDDNELLVINLPPRHGKSRTAGLAAQWYLGRDNTLKLIMASYNEKLSTQFSKNVRNDIQEIKSDENRIVFSDIFPDTKIQYGSAAANLWRLEGSRTDNYLSTSPKATVTGFGADIIFIDDIVKNAYEANHQGLLEEQFSWFTDTLYSRLEGKAKLIIIMTRWATKDLAGRVMSLYKEQGRKIRIISKKAFDGVKMLNPNILDKTRYDNLIQTIGEDIVKANYDQEPIDLKGRLYGEFITYAELPSNCPIHSVCDTADEGSDYLCNIIYALHQGMAYVIDVYYTQDGMDTTERELVRRLMANGVDRCLLESNFGGKAFAKVIERLSREAKNTKTQFKTFTQTQNKEARILSNATNVTRLIRMPERWEKLYPLFYNDVTEFQRTGKNQHDDAPDVLTMICEQLQKGRSITTSNLRI